jgi:hypothetical protein
MRKVQLVTSFNWLHLKERLYKIKPSLYLEIFPTREYWTQSHIYDKGILTAIVGIKQLAIRFDVNHVTRKPKSTATLNKNLISN